MPTKVENTVLECFELVPAQETTGNDRVSLTYDQRQKSRAKSITEKGQPVAWFLPRGHVLANGDCLKSRSGEIVQVVAADETVSVVQSSDAHLLMRAAYHLGNRHVPLQIDLSSLSYQHDHVLDAMVKGLGLTVVCEQRPFHPESGAYHNHSHQHSGQHAHKHHAH